MSVQYKDSVTLNMNIVMTSDAMGTKVDVTFDNGTRLDPFWIEGRSVDAEGQAALRPFAWSLAVSQITKALSEFVA